MDTAHALFETDGIPGNVIVDHQPAKLQVDAFAGRFRRDQHLLRFTKVALCENPGSGSIAIADLHTAVDLCERESPLVKFSERPAVAAVPGEVVQCVFV